MEFLPSISKMGARSWGEAPDYNISLGEMNLSGYSYRGTIESQNQNIELKIKIQMI